MQTSPFKSDQTSSKPPGSSTNRQKHLPMPQIVFKIANPLMKVLLRSPFAGRIGKSIMLITFTGRKTGRKYTTPIGYVRNGDTLIVFSHSNWWKNLRGGAEVDLRIQGKPYSGWATPIFEPESVKQMVQDLNLHYGEEMAKRNGFWVPNLDADPVEIVEDTRGVTFIRIRLNEDAHRKH